MANPQTETPRTSLLIGLSGPAVHVSDRVINSHKKASSTWPTSYETHTVASQKQLEGTGITGKGHSNSQVIAPPSEMVAGEKQCASKSTITPNKACSATYRHIKRRVGRSLKQAFCRKNLVPSRKQATYKLSRIESGPFGPERVPRPLLRQDSSNSNQQHYSSVIHKQGRRHEVGPPVCPLVDNPEVVYHKTGYPQSPTHPRPAECGSRQAIKARPDHPDRVVSPSGGFSINMQQVAQASDRPICNEVQQQVSPICVTSSGSPGLGSGRNQPAMRGSGCLCLPTSSHFGQSGGEVDQPCHRIILIAPGWPNMPWVLGSGGHVQPDLPQPA